MARSEIHSEQLAEIAAKTWKLKEDEVIHPLPIYADSFEGHNDPLVEKYPLQLTGFHYKACTQFLNLRQRCRNQKQQHRKSCGSTQSM
ncbi:hypothetical protein OK016_01885 [Vibrio chagasii]|nr:hypothetical protein [Vibrio chagasii]